MISHLYRDIASKKPRTITHVGLDTFVDPIHEGGKVNRRTRAKGQNLVERMKLDGKTFLAYKSFPINVAILRGTSADRDGNVTMEREALTLEALAIATAVRNSGGKVIVQVEKIARRGSKVPQHVKIPGNLVDYIVPVVNRDDHMQTFAEAYNPAYTGEKRIKPSAMEPMPAERTQDHQPPRLVRAAPRADGQPRIRHAGGDHGRSRGGEGAEQGDAHRGARCARRAACRPSELRRGGQRQGSDRPARDVRLLSGRRSRHHVPGAGAGGQAREPERSRFGKKLAGAGGFIDISQNAKKVVFVGTFTAGGLKTSIHGGELRIDQEGKVKKFRSSVEQITFSGRQSANQGKEVLYITERCVFKLTPRGQLELTEVAPGVDIKRDILEQMEFKPVIRGKPKLMDPRIFADRSMGLARVAIGADRLPTIHRPRGR